jgi:hypothetical protein
MLIPYDALIEVGWACLFAILYEAECAILLFSSGHVSGRSPPVSLLWQLVRTGEQSHSSKGNLITSFFGLYACSCRVFIVVAIWQNPMHLR